MSTQACIWKRPPPPPSEPVAPSPPSPPTPLDINQIIATLASNDNGSDDSTIILIVIIVGVVVVTVTAICVYKCTVDSIRKERPVFTDVTLSKGTEMAGVAATSSTAGVKDDI